MDSKSPYSDGHLFVAAIRILEHRHQAPPALDKIAELLNFSVEQTGLISRRMQEEGIVKLVQSAYGDRWVVAEHLKLEELPQATQTSQLDDQLKQYQAEKNKIAQKVASIKEQQAQKQKDLFANLEKKLKKDLADKKS
jgi:hypothetical protein